MAQGERETGRGRDAHRPRRIPFEGWKDILTRTWRELDRDNMFIVAGGVSFFATAALFPSLIALISLYGLLADPQQVTSGLSALRPLLPGDVYRIIAAQLHDIVSQSQASLGLGVFASLGLSLWTASSGVGAIVKALNIAYDERETRGFFKVKALSMLLTLGGLFLLSLNVALVAGLPAWLSSIGSSGWWSVLAWPLVFANTIFGLSLLYRFGPDRSHARFAWLTWGSIFATLLWAAASALFATYVSSFGSYQETYGTIAGFIVLIFWLYLTSLAVLLGAELNSEIEAQTAIDSTTGPPKPMGQRGATKADTLGLAREDLPA